jgi:PAS domain S-box-containing protein
MTREKVLIIDDEPDVLLLLKKYLLQMGYPPGSIIECTSYYEASSCDRAGIGCVICGLELPDAPRTGTLTGLKTLFPDIPVIIITNGTNGNDAFQLLAQGAEDYLEKDKIGKDVLERSLRYAHVRGRILSDYRRLFNENPAPMYIFDQDHFRFLAVNHAALDQYGYSREEFLSLTADQIRPAEDRDEFIAIVQEDRRQYADFGVRRHTRKDGSVFFVQIHAYSINFQRKDARLVMAINADERVRAKRALEEKAREMEELLQSITDGFFAVDEHHRFTYVNSTFEKMVQRHRDALIGKTLWEVFPEAGGTVFEIQYQQVVTSKASVHFEAFYRPLDIWLSANLYPSGNGISAFFMDITEQKRLQGEIWLNEQNLKATIDNTEDLIWSVDRELNIISGNTSFRRRMERITGQQVTALKSEYFPENVNNEWMAYYGRAFNGESFRVIRSLGNDDQPKYDEVRFNPIRNEHREVIGVSCISRDITEQQQHLDKIEKQNEQLRRIAWIQSHELRRPVANILGLIPCFNIQGMTAENAEVLRHLEVSALQLDEIIRRITVSTGEGNGRT